MALASTMRWAALAKRFGIGGLAAVVAPKMRSDGGTAPGPVTEPGTPKKRLVVVAATVMTSGDEPGEPTEPKPSSSWELPAAMATTTPARTAFSTAWASASALGSISVPPSDRLSTFMPSATARSTAAAISAVPPTAP